MGEVDGFVTGLEASIDLTSAESEAQLDERLVDVVETLFDAAASVCRFDGDGDGDGRTVAGDERLARDGLRRFLDDEEARSTDDVADPTIAVPVGNRRLLVVEAGTTDDGSVRHALDAIATQARSVRERLRTERELRVEQRRYSALFENTSDAIAWVEYEGETPIIRRVNARFEALFGSGAEVVGRSLDAVVTSEERREEAEQISRQVKRGETLTGELKRDTTDGTRHFLWRAVPLTDPDTGAVKNAYAVYSDISDLRRRERQIRTLYDVSRRMMRAETDDEVASVAIDAARSLADVDAVELFLYEGDENALVPTSVTGDETGVEPGDEPIGRSFERDAVVVHAASLASESPHPSLPGDVPLLCLPLKAHGVLVVGADDRSIFERDDDLEAYQLLAMTTETALAAVRREQLLRERERQLQRQNEQLEAFASVVAHDLRNPLDVAQGNAELLAEEFDDDRLASIREALARMATLIDDMLTLARQGQVVSDPEPVALDALVEEAWETTASSDATLDVDGLSGRRLQADEGRLREALENLFTNAIEHGGDDVTVTVGELDEGGFYVEDDGPGIPPSDREQVFEHGYTTDEEGTGFGLAIVESILEAHGWDVRVTGGSEGGARFEVRTATRETNGVRA